MLIDKVLMMLLLAKVMKTCHIVVLHCKIISTLTFFSNFRQEMLTGKMRMIAGGNSRNVAV